MGMPGNWQSSGKLRHAESKPDEVWECEKIGGNGGRAGDDWQSFMADYAQV